MKKSEIIEMSLDSLEAYARKLTDELVMVRKEIERRRGIVDGRSVDFDFEQYVTK